MTDDAKRPWELFYTNKPDRKWLSIRFVEVTCQRCGELFYNAMVGRFFYFTQGGTGLPEFETVYK